MPRLATLMLVAIGTVVPDAASAILKLPIHINAGYPTVEVEIGTPPTTHLLEFDTGSASAWVISQACAGYCKNISGYQRQGYNISASSSSTKLGIFDNIAYLGGSVAGPAIADIFTLPETNNKTLSWNQTFIAADTSTFSALYADGFLGLAFNTIAEPGTSTVVETLMQNGLLDESRFGIYFGKELNQTSAKPNGLLTLGGSHEDKYVDGNLIRIPLRNESEYQLWRIAFSSVTGSTEGGSNKSTKSTHYLGTDGRAVLDTGAGTLQLPTNIISDVYNSIGFNYTAILKGQHIPLCSEFNSSWSVTFQFGNETGDPALTLTGDQLARPGFANRNDACWPPFDNSGVNDFALIGISFLSQFYTVWDFGSTNAADYNPYVGFGKLKGRYMPSMGLSRN